MRINSLFSVFSMCVCMGRKHWRIVIVIYIIEFSGDLDYFITMATEEDEYYEEYGEGEEDGGKEGDDPELEEIKRRVQEMEKETEMLAKMQDQVENQIGSTSEVLDEHSV